MLSNRFRRISLAGALFGGLVGSAHAIQVVGDAACEHYAVDIAAFATCEDGRVVKPEASRVARPAADRPASAAAPAKGDVAAKPTSLARDDASKAALVPATRTR
jgi:hypothetical protein